MNETQETGEDYLLIHVTQSTTCGGVSIPENPFAGMFKVYSIIVLVLAPLNILLNGVSLRIFAHPFWKKSLMIAILKSLSVFEICFGSCLFLHTVTHRALESFISKADSQPPVSHQRNNTVAMPVALVLAHQVLSGFLFAFQVARNWSVVLLAAYRYDAICRKIGSVSSFSRKNIPIIMGITLACSGLFALPRIFEIKTFICAQTGLIYKEDLLIARFMLYELIYLGIGTFIVQSGGPVLCVCILSFFVIRKIVLRRRYRRQNQRTILMTNQKDSPAPGKEASAGTKTVERSQPSGDKLMLALCFTFFVLETPAFFSKILRSYTSKYHPLVDVYISVIANLLIYLDSMFNAFVYMCSNPQFRHVAKIMFVSSWMNKVWAKAKARCRCCLKRGEIVS